ncbi:MAG: flagellar basal-body rod protein FlgF [Clostridiales bacterium]|jgi:flagellar basal-body rod protein FlgG|nr:flagellar basal-body rod protein FlgF [Clostridiales bacterium]
MIRGLYTAASGMMVEAARQEQITNNLANSETTGFKKDLALQRARPEYQVIRIGNGPGMPHNPVIGSLGVGALLDRIHTSYEQGNLLQTDRNLDLAVAGNGFFAVDTPQGIRYTRNGSFSLDADRFLVTDQGYRVLGQNGPLQLGEGDVRIDAGGAVFLGETFQDSLRLVNFTDNSQLRKAGDALFATGENAEEAPFNGQVRSGFLESSNVEVLQEMIRMMAAMRAYETNQRAIQAQDDILGKAVNEIGTLR